MVMMLQFMKNIKNFGGAVEYGVPDYRLDRRIIEKTINRILELGIKVEYNKILGKDIFLKELEDNYDAIFLGLGRNKSLKMGIEGEEKEFVLLANEMLESKIFPDFRGKKVAVIGGGDVAMDAAGTAKRLGAEDVKIIYRRSIEEMPAEKIEIEEAKLQNIEFLFQTNITKILEDGKIECIKTELVEEEGQKRKKPVNISGSNFYLRFDYVIMAIGSQIDKSNVADLGLELQDDGEIIINDNNQTSKEKVFAGGELSFQKGSVAWAARSGRDAAYKIMEYLKDKV